VDEAMKASLLVVALLYCGAAAAEPARWTIDYAASRIEFTAEQAQAPFKGEFKTFEADVRFDPAALAQSSADVQVDTASVATSDKERDGILKGTGWFESEQFPKARFTAKEFVKTKDGYEAHGELAIRSAKAPVVLRFSWSDAGGRVELHGEADLDRFAFQLGLGDWADTKWIGKTVHVVVTLVGTR
jgi:polyisoprenoid-binding protein YceI